MFALSSLETIDLRCLTAKMYTLKMWSVEDLHWVLQRDCDLLRFVVVTLRMIPSQHPLRVRLKFIAHPFQLVAWTLHLYDDRFLLWLVFLSPSLLVCFVAYVVFFFSSKCHHDYLCYGPFLFFFSFFFFFLFFFCIGKLNKDFCGCWSKEEHKRPNVSFKACRWKSPWRRSYAI